jgi:quercetin dioxygenase-like cupin family protein
MPRRDLRFLTLAAMAGLLFATAVPAATPPVVTRLMTRTLADAVPRDVEMLTVEYAPGESSPAHEHHGDVFVYVLSGALRMQVAGGNAVTLHPGETFYEGPHDVHVVSANASTTEPARFLAFIVRARGAEPRP